MNIFIVTLTFPPEPAHHIQELAEELAGKGHRVTVLTSLPSYPYGKIYEKFRRRLFSIENVGNAKIVRLPIIPSHSKSFLKRSLFYVTNFLSVLIYQIITLTSKIDVAVAYHPPLTTAFNALFWKLSKGVPLVYWIHDMWPETLIEAGLHNETVLKIVGRLAKYVYKHSTNIIVLSKGFKQNLVDKGVDKEKIHVIPNWADPDRILIQNPDISMYKKVGLSKEDFHIFYIGNLGEMQALESVIMAMKILKDQNNIKMVFLGTGTRETELKKLTKELKIEEKIIFLGRVSPEEVFKYYYVANALLVHIKDTDLFRITIPHKIYEYMMAAKPIIAAIKGDAREVVLNADAGIACEPEDPESIASTIKQLKSMPLEKQASMGINGRKHLLETNAPDILLRRIENIIISSV